MTGALVDELRLPRDRRSIGASAQIAVVPQHEVRWHVAHCCPACR